MKRRIIAQRIGSWVQLEHIDGEIARAAEEPIEQLDRFRVLAGERVYLGQPGCITRPFKGVARLGAPSRIAETPSSFPISRTFFDLPR